jgi:hypothetical protein
VIVVIGSPLLGVTEAGPSAEGLAARIALTAAGAGSTVQLLGKVGEDEAGDAALLALARGGVGHVAVLREPGRATGRVEPVDRDRLEPSDDEVTPSGSALGAFPGPTLRLEAADVDLGLRYLTDFGVVVLAGPADADLAAVVARAVGWAAAHLVAVIPAGEPEPPGLPPESIVFEAPDADPDGVFASMVGAFVAALDEGGDAAGAFRVALAEGGWSAADDEGSVADD